MRKPGNRFGKIGVGTVSVICEQLPRGSSQGGGTKASIKVSYK